MLLMLYTKQLDLTSVFNTIQLPYCVSVLLLTSRCKLVPAQHTKVIIIWHLYEAFQKNKLRLLASIYHS